MIATPRPPATLPETAAALVAMVNQPTLNPGWRALYEAVTVQLFGALGRGELGAAAALRDVLQGAEGFLDGHRRDLGMEEEAAQALMGLLEVANLGAEGLEHPALEKRVRTLQGTTRAVLAVLREAAVPLTRGEVHERLPATEAPTKARISQILEELTRLGYALRERVAQGERLTAWYQISAEGLRVCKEYDVQPVTTPGARLRLMKGGATDRSGKEVGPEALAKTMETELRWGAM